LFCDVRTLRGTNVNPCGSQRIFPWGFIAPDFVSTRDETSDLIVLSRIYLSDIVESNVRQRNNKIRSVKTVPNFITPNTMIGAAAVQAV
jgi:hypothetical protein